MDVTLPYVVVAALVAALAGWGAVAALERIVARPRVIWTVLAVVVLVASLAMPLSAGVTTGDGIVLALMHVAVAAVLIPGLSGSSTRIR